MKRMLTWKVYCEEFNKGEIREVNIFDHRTFCECCKQHAKKFKDDKEAFAEAVRKDLMYYFWSKCEWEIILSAWPPRKNFRESKIDVYDQVMLNWNVFIDWLWEHKKEL